jgi:hypothetical protein
MPDVSVNVMIDGKTVFAYSAAGAPYPEITAIGALIAAEAHFHATRAAGANSGSGELASASQSSAVNTKGPSL